MREPGNSHDDKTIALCSTNGAMLGYLPRDLNTIPAALLDQKCSIANRYQLDFTGCSNMGAVTGCCAASHIMSKQE